MFKTAYWLLGTLALAFSLIGLTQRFLAVGLRGVFADLAAWSHAWSELLFDWVIGWPFAVLWPDFSPPALLIDTAVLLYIMTVLGARVVAAETFATIAPNASGLPLWKRWLAFGVLGARFYLVTLMLTATMIGPAMSIYAAVKGAAIAMGFPKSWTRVYDTNEAGRAQLRGLFVGTFVSLATAVGAVLVFFALNAYDPGL